MLAHHPDALLHLSDYHVGPLIFFFMYKLSLTVNTPAHTNTGVGGVPGRGVPAGPGVRLAERCAAAPAAGGCGAGEEDGEIGRASQASTGRGGKTGCWHERRGRKEGEKNNSLFVDISHNILVCLCRTPYLYLLQKDI